LSEFVELFDVIFAGLDEELLFD